MTNPHYITQRQEELLGQGAVSTPFAIERGFNAIMQASMYISAFVLIALIFPITIDVILRTAFNTSVYGLLDLESMGLILIGFLAIGNATVYRRNIQVDIVFNIFSTNNKLRMIIFGQLVVIFFAILLTWYTFLAAKDEAAYFASYSLPIRTFVYITSLGLLAMGIAASFQLFHSIKERIQSKDFLGILLVLALFGILIAAPFLYKACGVKISTLAIGGIGFLLVFVLLMLRVPLGMAMGFMGLIGMFALMRSTSAVGITVGMVPYRQCSEFIFLALPMFMLMGELIALAGLSTDLFNCAQKWLGRLPGGLAVAGIGGCAGFGAVCGDSMATVATMTSVALPPMRQKGYDLSLATGALAAGGTLGILIPPSTGFIIYSLLTEVSVGKLFTAGILPGIVLTLIFMAIVMIQVKLHPHYAPSSEKIPFIEKLVSLKGLIPIIFLFVVVVGGIMTGTFSPGEGGAIGAFIALCVALLRGKVTPKSLFTAVVRAANMCGAIFVLLVGVFIFGVFLTTSHLPALLAEFIVGIEANRYVVLFAILGIYILLGFVMNVQPMMMLTLPSLFPTIIALGFDGVWFGVLTVIVMEMGLITPPIGLNVFTLSAAAPDIPVSTIFKGVMPFFVGMCICVLLIVLFPQIALVLVN